MHLDTKKYNKAQAPAGRTIDAYLAKENEHGFPESENKIWHAYPVWFLDGNPCVGYTTLKDCIRLLFPSGQSFRTKGLPKDGRFKAAEARYAAAGQVDRLKLARWLEGSRETQWGYENILKRVGRLERVT
jgi:hypothetical protein